MNDTELSPQAACGCCAGVETRTPGVIDNRPGLPAVAYRIGRHGDFVASMLARLSSADYPALTRLRTRDADDYAIALLDAFGCVAEVLSFYQERIANESYLRTATERRSLTEMARLIGYRLKPGLAAETWLALTMEDAPGAPAKLRLEPGIKVQSVPGPDEKPQTFETVAALEARPAWNALRPRLTRSAIPGKGAKDCWLQGVDLSLKAGDGLLFVGEEVVKDKLKDNWDFRLITVVEPDMDNKRTHVRWEQGLGSVKPYMLPAAHPRVHVFRRKAAVFGHNAPQWKTMPKEFKDAYESLSAGESHSADWPGFTLSPVADSVDLDAVYPQITDPGWLVLAMPSYVELYRVSQLSELSRAAFAISAKLTRVKLTGENYALFQNHVRGTTAFAADEELHFAEAPETGSVEGIEVELETDAGELPPGRTLILTGEDAGSGTAAAEVVTLKSVAAVGGRSRLAFKAPLQHRYRRDTARILANVARAGHGETVTQILGSGDAARMHQRFDLKHAPLTHVAADSESGAGSTLELRVDDIAWKEAPTLFDAGADTRGYVLRGRDDGSAFVQFGDGRRGARLPSGRENVCARYRKGLGAAGNVAAAQLSQLMTRPLGLKSASNPLPAQGGSDPEGADAARRTMPLGVRTLGRTVSLADYEDFARAFAGIAKAHAAVLNLKAGRTVFVTIAGEQGTRPQADHPVAIKLVAAMKKSGDPLVRFEVRAYDIANFRLALKVKRHTDHLRERVFADVTAALQGAFAFEAREFGQPVALSEVVAVVERVPGVVAVDVDRFYRGAAIKREERLFAHLPRVDAQGNGLPAELLTLAPGPFDYLEEMP
jgi:hypothetical protein